MRRRDQLYKEPIQHPTWVLLVLLGISTLVRGAGSLKRRDGQSILYINQEAATWFFQPAFFVAAAVGIWYCRRGLRARAAEVRSKFDDGPPVGVIFVTMLVAALVWVMTAVALPVALSLVGLPGTSHDVVVAHPVQGFRRCGYRVDKVPQVPRSIQPRLCLGRELGRQIGSDEVTLRVTGYGNGLALWFPRYEVIDPEG